MKKILTMVIGLLTVIALFAVVAAARNGDGDADAPAATATASSEEANVAGDRDGDDETDDAGEDGIWLDQDGVDEDDADMDGTDRDRADETVTAWNKDGADGDDENHPRDRDRLGDKLQGLVEEGVLSADQLPALRDWFAGRGDDWKDDYRDISELLAELVADGVVTEEQADALAELWADKDSGKDDFPLFRGLAELGIITEDQVPAITDWIAGLESDADKDFDTLAGMLAAMVADEVITADQADAIADLLAQYEGMDDKDGEGRRHTDSDDEHDGADDDGEDGNRLDQDGISEDDADDDGEDPDDMDGTDRDRAGQTATAWNKDSGKDGFPLFRKLAELGIIADDQVTAITDWIAALESDADKDFDTLAGMLAAMVADEVITADQADAIADLLAQYEGMDDKDGEGRRHTTGSDEEHADSDDDYGKGDET